MYLLLGFFLYLHLEDCVYCLVGVGLFLIPKRYKNWSGTISQLSDIAPTIFSARPISELAPLEEIGPAQYVLPAIYPTDQMWRFEDAQFEHDLKDTGIES